MTKNSIPTASLPVAKVPSPDAPLEALIEFAHTFSGYEYWGSFERCAEIANAPDHTSIDKLRTCLFFEARRWRHGGDDPDDDALAYWRRLIAEIRRRLQALDAATPDWLALAIRGLPSDDPVKKNTQGYNVYSTQKDHWLGWLDPSAGTGTYPRRTSATARAVYNRIGEPKMLLWLVNASGADNGPASSTTEASSIAGSLASQCAAIRKAVPWRMVAEALLNRAEARSLPTHSAPRI